MKKIFIVLLLLPIIAVSQMSNANNPMIKSKVASKEGKYIAGRAFTSTTCDTTYSQDIRKWSSIYVTVQTLDSATVLIKYQLSLDGSNWGTLTTKDSLQQISDGVMIKNVDFSNVAQGAGYIRFVFQFSNYSGYLGSTTPYYTVLIKEFDQGNNLGKWVSFMSTDSITRGSSNATYDANDVMSPSTTAAASGMFAMKNVAYQNGGRFIITDLQVSGDSLNATNGIFILFLYKDSSAINHIADHSPMVFSSAYFNNRIGEISGVLTSDGAGTGSTSVYAYQTNLNLQGGCASNATTIYIRWVWVGAYKGANPGTYRIKIKGLQEVL